MAKYYFDSTDGFERKRDEVGTVLESRELARQHSQQLVATVAILNLPDGHRRDFIVDVRDETNLLIYTCSLSLHGRWLDFSVAPNENRTRVN